MTYDPDNPMNALLRRQKVRSAGRKAARLDAKLRGMEAPKDVPEEATGGVPPVIARARREAAGEA